MNEWLNKKTVLSRETSVQGDPLATSHPQVGQLISLKVWALGQRFIYFWDGPLSRSFFFFLGNLENDSQGLSMGSKCPGDIGSHPVTQAGRSWVDPREVGWWGIKSSWAVSSWLQFPRKQLPADTQSPVVTGGVESAGPESGLKAWSSQWTCCINFSVYQMRWGPWKI